MTSAQATTLVARLCGAIVAATLLAPPIVAQRARPSAQHTDAPPRIDGIRCGASAQTVRPPALRWRGTAVQWAEWRMVLGARAVAIRVVVARFRPRDVPLSLEIKRDGDAMTSWGLDDAPADAVIALNAGQFTDAGPWGWVMHRGREWQAPGIGSLAGALVVDSEGRTTLLDADALPERRAAGGVTEAIQSYPTLLNARGVAPLPLCTQATGADSRSIDRTHRDTRLAIGTLADGRLLVALSQYDGAGALASRLPIGPTTPEMAEIMRRLGARQALMLDGGLSAQLLVRSARDSVHQWAGLRRVPLALIGRAR